MSTDKEIAYKTLGNCPAGRNGVITIQTYKDGSHDYTCSMGSNYIQEKMRYCGAGLFSNCQDAEYWKKFYR